MPEELDILNTGKELISWKFPEHPQYKRSVGWYILSIMIGLGLLIFALVTFNFLFAIIIIIAAIIYIFHHHDEALEIEFSLTTKGVILGNRFIPYRDLKKFWIVYEDPDVKNLYLDQKAILKPTLVIPLENQNPLKVRRILLDYLEEDLDKEEEGAIERLGRIFKL